MLQLQVLKLVLSQLARGRVVQGGPDASAACLRVVAQLPMPQKQLRRGLSQQAASSNPSADANAASQTTSNSASSPSASSSSSQAAAAVDQAAVASAPSSSAAAGPPAPVIPVEGGWVARDIKKRAEEVKKTSSWWTRIGPDGEPVPMATWEKLYWGLGVGGLALFLLPRIQYATQKDDVEEKERAKKALEAKRKSMIPLMATGKSFLEEEEAKLYDGLSPQELNKLAVSSVLKSAMTSDDPFEGLTPEEIDALYGQAPSLASAT